MSWVSWSDKIRTWGSDLAHCRCLENTSDQCHPNARGRWDLLPRPHLDHRYSFAFFGLQILWNHLWRTPRSPLVCWHLHSTWHKWSMTDCPWPWLQHEEAGEGGLPCSLVLIHPFFQTPSLVRYERTNPECPQNGKRKLPPSTCGQQCPCSPFQHLLTSEQASEA